jgi:hypothetical protein
MGDSHRACYIEVADAGVDAPRWETCDQCWEDNRQDVRACASSQKQEEQKHEHSR